METHGLVETVPQAVEVVQQPGVFVHLVLDVLRSDVVQLDADEEAVRLADPFIRLKVDPVYDGVENVLLAVNAQVLAFQYRPQTDV